MIESSTKAKQLLTLKLATWRAIRGPLWVTQRCWLTARGKPRNPAPGCGLLVRLQPHELALLDKWMVQQEDENRQAAVRRLIALVCGYVKEK
jgi:hypothetical protein